MIRIFNACPLGALAAVGMAASLAACSGAQSGSTSLPPQSHSVVPRSSATLRANSSFSTIYGFSGQKDGSEPDGSLIADASGALYGVTCDGGKFGFGNVFKLAPSGSSYKLSTIYSFKGGNDGICPSYALVPDGQGAFYGVTVEGGGLANYGTVYKLAPKGSSGYKETVLHAFQNIDEGRAPQQLLLASDGALYGLAEEGGTGASCAPYCGTAFKLTPSGQRFKLSVLYQFQGGTTDGTQPHGSLVLGKDGRLYGTTQYSGDYTCSSFGCGVLFALDPSGKETILHTFSGGQDGANPVTGLTMDTKGNFFGTTYAGGGAGSSICYPKYGALGCGTVYSSDASGKSYGVLFAFTQQQQGSNPYASLTFGPSGTLYGTTYNGGSAGGGVLYKLQKHGKTYKQTILHQFAGASDGRAPFSSPLLVGENLYGTTQFGGPVDRGTVFEATR
jgi:uncharacterized repeat protein (TIGR03803 family)